MQAIHTAQEREQAAERVASAKNDVKQLYLIKASEADLRQLRQAIQADGLSETVRLFKELEASHNIYQMSLAGQAESNHARAVLLKQHLLANYVPFHSRTPAGRVLFKFGAMHMGRGFDPYISSIWATQWQKSRMSKACNRCISRSLVLEALLPQAGHTANRWRQIPSICSPVISKPGGLHPLSPN